MSQQKIGCRRYEDLQLNIPPQTSPPSQVISDIDNDISSTSDYQASVFVMAGAAAGIMEHCIMYPIDSVKTRMQSLRPHPQAVYRSVKHALLKITSTEGITRPLRGINVVAMGAGPAHAMYFGSYEIAKKTLGNNGNGGHFPITNAVSGVIATIFHDGTMNPIDVIKQRIQMYNSPYRGTFDCIRCVMKSEGVGAFYRSYTTQLTMNIPFQCLQFVTYEFMRETLNPSGGYSPITHLIAGATAGGMASALTNPLDVAKTLLNTQESNAVSELIKNKSSQRLFIKGMFNALRTIYVLQGLPGYFQGVQARVIYQMPSCAISWSVYEFFKNYLSLKITDEDMLEVTL